MAMPVEAKDAAVGDYSPDYGHVKQVIKDTELKTVTLIFRNKKEITVGEEQTVLLDQGGRF